MSARTPLEVVQRAIVMGAVAFRASLEVTDHPRTAEIAARIPNWLAALDLTTAIDPTERDLLDTPYGQLSKWQRVDANWAGEGAALFCWTLGIGEPPPLFRIADHGAAIRALKIMCPEARELLHSPSLRPADELREFCKTVRLMHVWLREMHIQGLDWDSEKRRTVIALLRQTVRRELAAVGIEIGDEDFEQPAQLVARAKPDEPRAATGAYVARDTAATWLLDGRARYFDAE